MAAADQGRLLFDELMRFRPDGLTANAWAVKAGVSRNFWNDLRRHGNPSRRILEKLLAAADSSLAEFEALAHSAGTEVLGLISGTRRSPDPRLFVGSGKAEEIRDAASLINHE